jgi:hypothetical protein
MKSMRSILSVIGIAIALWVSTVPYAQACDHDYEDEEVESQPMPS